MSTPTDVIEVALIYAAKGIPVFPLIPGGKEPKKGSSGYLDATTDADTIRKVFKTGDNIAMWCRDILVVDVDPRHGGDVTAREYGTKLPVTIIQKTAHDGMHALYRNDMNLPSKNDFDKGIDIKGSNGYVVVYPSVVDGKMYEWLSKGKPVPTDPAFDISTLLGTPAWIAAKFEDRKVEPTTNEVIEIVKEGGRHDFILRKAAQLRRTGLSAGELYAALSAVNVSRCVPPLPDNEVKQISIDTGKKDRFGHIKPTTTELIEEVTTYHQPTTVKRRANDTAPIAVNLADDNFVKMYMKYVEMRTSGYPDYAFAGSLAILSAIADRQCFMQFSYGTIYSNMWMQLIGTSSISKKSKNVDYVEETMKSVMEDNVNMPTQFSPEGLVEFLSDFPRCSWLVDESSIFLKQMSKKYMADTEELLSRLYDCKGLSRKLRSKKSERSEFVIKDPYLTVLMATTPEMFANHVDMLNVTSGWLVRFLFFYPQYPLQFRPSTKFNPFEVKARKEVELRISDIRSFIFDRQISFVFNESAVEYFNAWEEKHMNKVSEESSDIVMTSFGTRMVIYAAKLAILFTIGESKFVTIKSPTVEIDLATVKEATRLVEEYFMPMARRVFELVESAGESNTQQRILNVLKARTNGECDRGTLLRKTRMGRKELDDAIAALFESEEIEIRDASTSTKPKTLYRLKSLSPSS